MLIPLSSLEAKDELLHLVADGRPLGGQQRQAATHHLIDQEEVELLPQLAMVALAGLLELREVGVELRLRRKRRAVDASQLLILFAALPVGAGD